MNIFCCIHMTNPMWNHANRQKGTQPANQLSWRQLMMASIGLLASSVGIELVYSLTQSLINKVRCTWANESKATSTAGLTSKVYTTGQVQSKVQGLKYSLVEKYGWNTVRKYRNGQEPNAFPQSWQRALLSGGQGTSPTSHLSLPPEPLAIREYTSFRMK